MAKNNKLVKVENQGPSRPLVLDLLKSRKSIASQGDYDSTAKLLAEVKSSQRKVKAEKDKVLAPLLEATKAERARWSPIEQQLEAAERSLKAELIDYINGQEAKAEKIKADRRITSSETLVKRVEAVAVAKASEVSVRKIQQLVIVDESLIPRSYMIIDQTKIRQALLSGQEVPGAKLETVNSLAAF